MLRILSVYILIFFRLIYAMNEDYLDVRKSQVILENDGYACGLKKYIGEKLIYTFKGIPFAKPPIGDLRFKKTEGINVTEHKACNNSNYNYSAGCLQPVMSLSGVNYVSEDCLYLNIWTQSLNSDPDRRFLQKPVLFWIHGGGFFVGSSEANYGPFTENSANYDGTNLALKDVVVVTINYRLGVFGFLFDNSTNAPGNQGIWDIVEALDWTKRNIEYFGGNPLDITLFGESAGSIAISLLIVSNKLLPYRNYFNKAIMFSGTAYNEIFTQNPDYGYKLSKSYATYGYFLKCILADDWVSCLQNKSGWNLVTSEVLHMIFYGKDYNSPMHFTPIYGDYYNLIPKNPKYALDNREFRNDINILISHLEMEGTFMAKVIKLDKSLSLKFLKKIQTKYFKMKLNEAIKAFTELLLNKTIDIFNKYIAFDEFDYIIDAKDQLYKIFTKYMPKHKRKIVNAYFKGLNNYKTYREARPVRYAIMHSLGDFFFTCPTILYAAKIVQDESFVGKVYQTRFTYEIPRNLIDIYHESLATHGEDLKYIFGIPNNIKSNEDERKVSQSIMKLVTDFAKKGHMPNFYMKPYKFYPETNTVEANYLELGPYELLHGPTRSDAYRGIEGYLPSVINNCFNFWDEIFWEQ